MNVAKVNTLRLEPILAHFASLVMSAVAPPLLLAHMKLPSALANTAKSLLVQSRPHMVRSTTKSHVLLVTTAHKTHFIRFLAPVVPTVTLVAVLRQ